MKVTRSRSMRVSAASGSQRAMNTVRNGTTPGRVMPFSRPEMCGAGRGHQHAVVGSERVFVRVVHLRGLVRERGLRVQHAFRRAARSRREQHRREPARVGPRHVDRVAGRERVEVVDDERRPHRVEHAGDVARTHQVVHRCRDRAEPPARAVQDATSSRLADCHATASPGPTPRARSPPATRATRSASAGAATRVSSTSSDGRSHGPPGRR